MKIRKLFMFILPCLFISAGCGTPPQPPPYVPQVNTYMKDRSEVLDANFAQWLPVREIGLAKTNDGYNRVCVSVKNVTVSPIRASYKIEWMTADREVVVDPDHSAWEKMTLKAGADGALSSIAPRKECVDFRLSIKYVP